MRKLLNPFVVVLTLIVALAYFYLSTRITSSATARLALGIPFALVWIVPIVYWVWGRDSIGTLDEWVHNASYLSMGWLNFALLFSLARDALAGISKLIGVVPLENWLHSQGTTLVLVGSLVALATGFVAAWRGPHLRRVSIPIDGLDPACEGLRIAQISDLHVGPTIRESYVRRVVEQANALKADLIALTGDMVDGSVPRLRRHVAPLADLSPRGRVFFVLGNHDCYSGAPDWIAHFRSLGFHVLLNEYAMLERGAAQIVLGGVVDPALRLSDRRQSPQPELALGPQHGVALRILLAHNPNVARQAQKFDFDLQLSGHTHAGQFFPWTLAVHLVHAPLVSGLSRLGRMWVYVSAGTGTWGPPIRFGTKPELTLLEIVSSEVSPTKTSAA